MKLKQKIFFITPLIILLGMVILGAYSMLEHNPQEAYCKYTALSGSLVSETKKNYVREGWGYVEYDAMKHHTYETIYVELKGYNIEDANWKNSNGLCIVKSSLYWVLFVNPYTLIALLFYGFIYGTAFLRTKNSRNKELE